MPRRRPPNQATDRPRGLGLALTWAALVGLLGGCKEQTSSPAPPAEVCPADQAETCFDKGVALLGERPGKAAEAFERGCARDHAGCCNNLAQLLAEGRGVTRDTPRAATLYMKACNGGLGHGCTGLAELQLKVDGPDQGEVQKLLEQACELGHAPGCLQAGSRWAQGTGVKDASKEEAMTRWEKACRGGVARGCASLGLNLVLGFGADKDPERGQQLLLRACNGSDAAACKDLGGLHLAKLLPESDPAKGVVLLKNACNLGYGEGCNELAVAHAAEMGGLARDAAAIAGLFEKACRLESPAGCGNYALALLHGDGIEPNHAEAQRLLQAACKQKHEPSCEHLEELSGHDHEGHAH